MHRLLNRFRLNCLARSETALVVVLFFTTWTGAYAYLACFTNGPCHDYNNSNTYDLMPAVTCAIGYHVPSEAVASLRDFLEKKTPAWTPGALPHNAYPDPMDGKFTRDRLYMFYAIAFTWRLLGFSWAALELFISGVFALMAVVAYGIFRLAMGRLMSLTGTLLFLLSPVTLFWLPSMRDFFRAPPILATVLICGYLATRRVSRTVFLLLGAALGLIIGVGIGFRQDAIICIPPALFTLALLARGKVPTSIGLRLLAMTVFLLMFAVLARPILKDTQSNGGNNAFYMLQGFSSSDFSQLDVRESSYVPFYSVGDLVVHAGVYTFEDVSNAARRNAEELENVRIRSALLLNAALTAIHNPVESCISLGLSSWLKSQSPSAQMDIWSPESEWAARRLEGRLLLTFPADFITKWYSAVIRATRGLQGGFHSLIPVTNPALDTLAALEAPLMNHLNRWGAIYGLLVLFVFAARSRRLAFVAAFFVFYFCGYSSISFQIRHAFHLQLVSIWIPCLLIDRALSMIRTARGVACKRVTLRWSSAPIKRLLAFSALASLLFFAPLYAARLYQHATVTALAGRYAKADLEPLEWDEYDQQVDVPPGVMRLRRPLQLPGLQCSEHKAEDWLWSLMGHPKEPCTGIRMEYLVIEMEPAEGFNYVRVRYRDNSPNLQTMLTQDIRGTSAGGTVRCFFPVYDYPPGYTPAFDTSASRFAGIEIFSGARFKGFYRVRNKQDFPVPLTLWLPSTPEQLKWYQGITPIWPS